MDELVLYIREALDRKQGNVRRQRRRDALRLQLVRIFQLIADRGTFGMRYFDDPFPLLKLLILFALFVAAMEKDALFTLSLLNSWTV